MAPLSMCITAMGKPLVLLLLGEKWNACIPIFQVACFSNFPMMLMLVNLRAYMALGNSGLYFRINIIKIAIGMVAVGGTAIATGDIYTVAYVTAIYSVLTVFCVDMVPAKRETGLGWCEQMKLVLPILALSTVSMAITVLVGSLFANIVVVLLTQITCFSSVYLGVSSVLHLEGYVELRTILSGVIHKQN